MQNSNRIIFTDFKGPDKETPRERGFCKICRKHHSYKQAIKFNYRCTWK